MEQMAADLKKKFDKKLEKELVAMRANIQEARVRVGVRDRVRVRGHKSKHTGSKGQNRVRVTVRVRGSL